MLQLLLDAADFGNKRLHHILNSSLNTFFGLRAGESRDLGQGSSSQFLFLPVTTGVLDKAVAPAVESQAAQRPSQRVAQRVARAAVARMEASLRLAVAAAVVAMATDLGPRQRGDR